MERNKKVRHLNGNVMWNGRIVPARMTIVTERTAPDTIKYKVAYCSPHDQFCKRTGVQIAELSDKEYSIKVRESDTHSDISFAVITDLIKNREDAPKIHRRYLEGLLIDVVMAAMT